MNFNTIGSLICGQEAPSFLGIFDFSTAPQLLFYSYIPIIIASALIGCFIFIKDRKSLQSKLLLSVIIFFILWVLNILVQWVASYHTILMFAWQLTDIFEVGLYLATAYFAYVFINKKDLPFSGKLILWVLGLTVICLTPTILNVSSYDLQNCEGVVGPLWNIIYAFEPVIIILIIYMGFVALRKEQDKLLRKQIIIFTSSLAFFLATFFIFNFYGELTRVYEFNLWGPVGMVVFFIFLVYLIVKFHTFNIKLIATQALVWGLTILIGSQFFFIKVPANFILNGIGFFVSIILGQYLIKAVKKEIKAKENEKLQHEKFEELAGRFENINHILAHDVKNTLGKNKDIFIEALAGTFGEITDQGKSFFKRLATDTVDLIASVTNILKAGDKINPNPQPFDLKQAVLEVIESVKDTANTRGLKIETQIDENQDYTVNADRSLIVQHVLKNLIENAVNYNIQNGSIWINLSKKDPKTVLLVVKDNGHGMSEETKKKLFTAGGHGEDSIKFNVHTSGYGLLIARQTMDAHNGKVNGNSEGKEKGSTFFMELPVDFTPIVSEAPKK